jgi:hypothetical protein
MKSSYAGRWFSGGSSRNGSGYQGRGYGATNNIRSQNFNESSNRQSSQGSASFGSASLPSSNSSSSQSKTSVATTTSAFDEILQSTRHTELVGTLNHVVDLCAEVSEAQLMLKFESVKRDDTMSESMRSLFKEVHKISEKQCALEKLLTTIRQDISGSRRVNENLLTSVQELLKETQRNQCGGKAYPEEAHARNDPLFSDPSDSEEEEMSLADYLESQAAPRRVEKVAAAKSSSSASSSRHVTDNRRQSQNASVVDDLMFEESFTKFGKRSRSGHDTELRGQTRKF